MLRKVLAIVAVVLVIGAAIGYYLWNKPHRTAADEKPVATLTAEELFNQYSADAAGCDAKYLEKAIQVSGTINSVKKTETNELKVALATSDMLAEISCIMKEGEKTDDVKEGTNIVLKGICNGYNTDVELRQTVIVK